MAGLREARKATTYQSIVDAAMGLAHGRSFRDISIDEIAAAAGIGRRTFFRYFPTKEDAFLDRRRIDHAFIAAELNARVGREDDVALLMRVLVEVQRRAFAPFRPEHHADLHRLTHFEPELAARSWLLMEEVRDLLVSGLVGPEADASELLRGRVLASACIMVMDAGITTWIERGAGDDLESILSEGADHLRRGFAARAGSVPPASSRRQSR